jgi:hypothetical protein
MSNVQCSECDGLTLETCPTCHETPLCGTCRELVGECAECAPDDDDMADDFDDLDDDDDDDEED